MGSSSSKAARGAVGAARKYPTRAPGAVPQATSRSKPQPTPRGNGSKDDAIHADAMDPDFTPGDFSRRLHQMGIVEPNPTYSPSSRASPHLSPESLDMPAGPLFPSVKHNTTLSALEARRRLQQRAEEDFEAMGRNGSRRRLVDMRTLLDAIELRNRGLPAAEIETRLRLEPNMISKLGPSSILSRISSD